jgi:hypothetical protein
LDLTFIVFHKNRITETGIGCRWWGWAAQSGHLNFLTKSAEKLATIRGFTGRTAFAGPDFGALPGIFIVIPDSALGFALSIGRRTTDTKIIGFPGFLAGGAAHVREDKQSGNEFQKAHDDPVRKNGHPNDERTLV